jgi:hypothetical protein
MEHRRHVGADVPVRLRKKLHPPVHRFRQWVRVGGVSIRAPNPSFPFAAAMLACAWIGNGSADETMIHETIGKIEERLRGSDAVRDDSKAELLGLLATLKAEVSDLSRTNADQAQSIAGFTAVSAHEATRGTKDPELVQLSLKGLSSSVEGFEQSHPRLVQVVNSICTTLSNLGI